MILKIIGNTNLKLLSIIHYFEVVWALHENLVGIT